MGKGSSPRSCFSKKFKENYDSIDWHPKKCYICNIRIDKYNLIKHNEMYEIDSEGNVKHKNCF